MSLETEIRALRPALDRAIDDAERTIASPRIAAPVRDGWSRARFAVVAFAIVAVVAGAVGVAIRLDSGGRNHTGTSVPPTSTASTSPPPTSVATSTTTAPTTSTTGVALSTVDWSAVDYPITAQCGTVFTPAVTVMHVVYATPTAAVPVAIVQVDCTHGAGTPAVALYVYDGAASPTAPHLAATLLSLADGWQAGAVTADGATASLPVSGFSNRSIPNCCPDVRTTLVWQWTAGRYELVTSVPPHVAVP